MRYYSLQIEIENTNQINKITSILNIKPSDSDRIWKYTIEDKENEPIDYINILHNIIYNKMDQLKLIGIPNHNISIWLLYEYEQQCNMEFNSEQLLLLGKLGVSFCISCWQKDSYLYFE